MRFKLILTLLRSATISGEPVQILSCSVCHCLVSSSEMNDHERYHDLRGELEE